MELGQFVVSTDEERGAIINRQSQAADGELQEIGLAKDTLQVGWPLRGDVIEVGHVANSMGY